MGIMSMLAKLKNKRPSAAQRLYGEIDKETPEAAQSYLDQTIRSLSSSAMPEFNARLQDVQENAIRRGASGGLGTSYEGDLASAFERNIANTAGQYAYSNYEGSRNRYLDLLTGQRDYDTYLAEQKRKRKGGLFGALGSIAGGVGGFFLGGPAGAAAGAQIGGSAGSGIGGS
jgi:hypothetical protein